jgi:HAE1 family hydrophobic/amphiphilic exporter-1
VVGGLVFSQLLTLYITPVVYTYMDAFQRWIEAGRRQTPAPMETTVVPARRRALSSR